MCKYGYSSSCTAYVGKLMMVPVIITPWLGRVATSSSNCRKLPARSFFGRMLMNKNKYASARAGSSTSNGQGQSFAPIIIGVNKGEKVIYTTVQNVCVFKDKADTEVLLITHNAGIHTLGKLDYIRNQPGFPRAVYRLEAGKKFGGTININNDIEPFRG